MPDAPGSESQQNGGGTPAADDKPLTKADFQALLAAELPKVVNSAVTSHMKRGGGDVDSRIAKALEPFKALLPQPAAGDEAEPGDDDPTKKNARPAADPKPPAGAQQRQPDPELEALRRELAGLRKSHESQKGELTKERDARTKAERQRVEDAGYATLKGELAGKVLPGVEGDVVDLLRARGRVTITETGDVRLKLGHDGEPEEGLSLKDGIAAHLKSPEAKHFLPAPNAGPLAPKPKPFQSQGNVLQQKPQARPGGAAPPKTNVAEAFAQKTGLSLEDAL